MDENIIDDFNQQDRQTGVIAQYFSVQEAEFAAAAIRSEGIHCFIANKESSAALGLEMSPVRLHVDANRFDEAKGILNKIAENQSPPTTRRGNPFQPIFVARLATFTACHSLFCFLPSVNTAFSLRQNTRL